jgi:hypothetical protein
MTFTAILRRDSHLWREWRARKAVSAELHGVPFRLVPGLDYVTGELTANQVEALKGHRFVRLEVATGGLPDAVDTNGHDFSEPTFVEPYDVGPILQESELREQAKPATPPITRYPARKARR